MITVVVTPRNEEFNYEWKLNGETMPDENDAIFPLPLTVSGNDLVKVVVSSDCGATASASIFVLINDTFIASTSETSTAGKSTTSTNQSTTGKSWRCMNNFLSATII